ncbi:MAG: hypothetical protein UR12_C0005G0037 [candidate division TM6 bacterium GW2011_GWF2_30_66]|nr:MAG: hypothetical protein UR12_C0005G0037 [candidate division TM6 bacterium GW2011_GWF2_30_66]
MKKSLVFTLFLLTITTQIKSAITRGAVYENKKTGQSILLLGDIHDLEDQKNTQRNNLIEQLCKLDKKSNITIVEDTQNKNVNKNNSIYLKAMAILNNFDCKTNILNSLESDLIKKSLNVKNIESRYINGAICGAPQFIQAYNNLDKNQKNLYLKEFDFFTSLPKKLNQDLLLEIQNNINSLKTQIKELPKLKTIYQKENYEKIINYFDNTLSEASKKNYKDLVEKVNTLDPKFLLEEKHGEPLRKISQMINPIIDAKIIYNILRNIDKKNIFVCAGISHTVNVEKFIDKIDYKLKKVIGLDSVDVDSPNNEDLIQKIIKLNPKPININELFEN